MFPKTAYVFVLCMPPLPWRKSVPKFAPRVYVDTVCCLACYAVVSVDGGVPDINAAEIIIEPQSTYQVPGVFVGHMCYPLDFLLLPAW